MLAVGGYVMGDFDPSCVRMTTPLAGGVGESQQEMCGALSGGLLVIGAVHGRCRADEDDSVALHLAAQYRARFRAELGETQCGLLYKRVHASDGLGSCSRLVERAARILLDLLGGEE